MATALAAAAPALAQAGGNVLSSIFSGIFDIGETAMKNQAATSIANASNVTQTNIANINNSAANQRQSSINNSNYSLASLASDTALRSIKDTSDFQLQRYNYMTSRAEDALIKVGLPTYLLYTNNIPTVSSFTPGSRGTLTNIVGANPTYSFRRGF